MSRTDPLIAVDSNSRSTTQPASTGGAEPGGADLGPESRSPDAKNKLGINISPLLALLGAALVAGLPAFATLLGIIFDLFPALRQEAPAVLGAVLSEVALEERGTDSATGAAVLVVSYNLEFTGYKGDYASVDWVLFDPVRQERLTADAFAVPPSDQDVRVEPEANTDRVSAYVRLPVPLKAGCVVVRVYVFDEQGSRLDYADTAPFHTHDPTQDCGASPEPTAPLT